MKKRIMISTCDPGDTARVGRFFSERGWVLLVSAETAVVLKAAGLPFEDVREFTGVKEDYGFPPTLHPKIEYALADETCEERIEIVFDTPYSPEQGMDVGGHTLLALAVKGDRVPVSTYEDMDRVMTQLREAGKITAELKRELQVKALKRLTAFYGHQLTTNDTDYFICGYRKSEKLFEGQNPYQAPAYYCEDWDGNGRPDNRLGRVGGQAPCYTNVADMDSVLHTLRAATKAFWRLRGKVPFIAICAKHGNPCGLAVDWEDRGRAIKRALWGNARAVWGGEFASNFAIDEDCARLLTVSEERKERLGAAGWMLDVIVTAGMERAALDVFGKRERSKAFVDTRLLTAETLPDAGLLRPLRDGGCLVQPPDDYVLDFKVVTWTGSFDEAQTDALIIAWAAAYTSFYGGNEVALAKDGALLGAGGGPSTVEAAEAAVRRAAQNGHVAKESVFCADAFLPFTDAAQVLAEAGCTGGVVPAGGIREHELRQFFEEQGMSVGFIPEPYRGFCRH